MQVEEPLANYNGNPQTEDGFTKIANELLEAIILADFTKRQYKIVLCLIRQTYGYGKKIDDITISQIAGKTGLNLSHASATVAELIKKNVIIEHGRGKHGKLLAINKKYDSWVTETVSYQNGNVTETVILGYQNGKSMLPKREVEVTKTVNTKDNPKRNFQKIIPKDRETEVSKPKRQQLPENFKPKPSHQELANNAGISLQTEFLQFADYHRSKGSLMANWDLALNTWLRNTKKYQRVLPANNKPASKADRFNAAMDRVFNNRKEIENERDITASSERLD